MKRDSRLMSQDSRLLLMTSSTFTSTPMATASEDLFRQAWALYEKAFPEMERREESLHRQLMVHPQFHAELLIQEQQLVGLLFWWQFDGMRFIEHFAIAPELRGLGTGQTVLRHFLAQSNQLLVLEAEPPGDAQSRRRIDFYLRLNFTLNPFAYQQLPMRVDGSPVDLLLLSYPRQLQPAEFEAFKLQFRTTCFEPYLKVFFPDI